MLVIITNLIFISLLFVAIIPWLFVLKIGGKARIGGALGVLTFLCVPLGLLHVLTINGLLINKHPFGNVVLFGIVSGVLALLAVSRAFLKITNDLFSKIGFILESKNLSGTFSKRARIWLLLRLKLANRAFNCMTNAGRITFWGYSISYPNFNHLQELLIEIFINREYAVASLDKPLFIIDCGANIGITTLFLKRMYPNAKMLCFEPDPINFDFLKKNIEINGLQQISLEQKALAFKAGQIALAAGLHTESSTVFFQVNDNVVLVDAVPLSTYISETVDLLKIDIEGAESQVIEDLYQSDKLIHIKNIIMEYHYTLSDQNNLAQTLAFLEKSGFSYEVRSQSSSLTPYVLHSAGSRQKKIYTVIIFACNKKFGI